jgi:hypothetical protein
VDFIVEKPLQLPEIHKITDGPGSSLVPNQITNRSRSSGHRREAG